MSFQGYYQLMCDNGHIYAENASLWDDFRTCPHCNAACVWSNLVDQTNDDGADDVVDFGRPIAPARVCDPAPNCPCGKSHAVILEPERYAIPNGKGHKVQAGAKLKSP